VCQLVSGKGLFDSKSSPLAIKCLKDKSGFSNKIMAVVSVRPLLSNDVDAVAALLQKFWSLNAEFEPTIEVDEKALASFKDEMRTHLDKQDQIVLVAESGKGGFLSGFIRVEIKKDRYYGAQTRGNIVEFYVTPQSRRRDIGKSLLDSMVESLKERGIVSVTAEFPTQNVPALSFYERNGFRPFLAVYAKDIQ
jgi:ribosomal protein S18 acetylase RimI-like enzyme